MRFIIAGVAAALLSGGAAMAQDHAAHHPGVSEARAKAADAKMHEDCKANMGRMTDPKQPHDHAREKMGIAAHPVAKPLSSAEMKAMHDNCQAMMAEPPSSATAPTSPR
jgi:hypothetical protein